MRDIVRLKQKRKCMHFYFFNTKSNVKEEKGNALTNLAGFYAPLIVWLRCKCGTKKEGEKVIIH